MRKLHFHLPLQVLSLLRVTSCFGRLCSCYSCYDLSSMLLRFSSVFVMCPFSSFVLIVVLLRSSSCAASCVDLCLARCATQSYIFMCCAYVVCVLNCRRSSLFVLVFVFVICFMRCYVLSVLLCFMCFNKLVWMPTTAMATTATDGARNDSVYSCDFWREWHGFKGLPTRSCHNSSSSTS